MGSDEVIELVEPSIGTSISAGVSAAEEEKIVSAKVELEVIALTLCKNIAAMPLLSLHAINHRIPLIDETKNYQ